MTLKRTAMRPGASMKRTAFARVAAREKSEVSKLRMKSSRPKMTPIRASAKGEECTLRFPCCNFNTETTVWAHSNSYTDGKGMGIKARDEEGCYACGSCHAWLDGGYAGHVTRALVDLCFNNARSKSQKILREKGLM